MDAFQTTRRDVTCTFDCFFNRKEIKGGEGPRNHALQLCVNLSSSEPMWCQGLDSLRIDSIAGHPSCQTPVKLHKNAA